MYIFQCYASATAILKRDFLFFMSLFKMAVADDTPWISMLKNQHQPAGFPDCNSIFSQSPRRAGGTGFSSPAQSSTALPALLLPAPPLNQTTSARIETLLQNQISNQYHIVHKSILHFPQLYKNLARKQRGFRRADESPYDGTYNRTYPVIRIPAPHFSGQLHIS